MVAWTIVSGHLEVTVMNVTIKGNKLVIEAELGTPVPSTSGKSLVIASTRGNLKTTAKYNGQPVTVGLNVYIPVVQQVAAASA